MTMTPDEKEQLSALCRPIDALSAATARIAELEKQNAALLNKVGEQGAQIGTLEFERDEAYRVLSYCLPPMSNGYPLLWAEHIIDKARAFVEGARKEAREG